MLHTQLSFLNYPTTDYSTPLSKDCVLSQEIHSVEHVKAVVNTTVSAVYVNQSMMLGGSQLYQIIYSNLLYYPVMYIVPLGTLAFLNVRLIAALNAIKRRTLTVRMKSTTSHVDVQSLSHRRRRKDDNITLCIVVIVSVFIVCQTPAVTRTTTSRCVSS